ncbi:hypothetical protein KsCSTR_01590 [Candidatus Kuenenia stuttgartiensis]|uniref:Uncharacterized protein n=1 Tax=Kuenenia stuttgartiensis TaxID=174633 RepID=Q1PUZ0_KUEST|nr:hypothetical protein KsCSTR_01590 [Candidatus Kuenenia stuttgartiensis]CAJ71043.1 unknown protein [Candidatus Kuenenia stuttgartiensis]
MITSTYATLWHYSEENSKFQKSVTIQRNLLNYRNRYSGAGSGCEPGPAMSRVMFKLRNQKRNHL